MIVLFDLQRVHGVDLVASGVVGQLRNSRLLSLSVASTASSTTLTSSSSLSLSTSNNGQVPCVALPLRPRTRVNDVCSDVDGDELEWMAYADSVNALRETVTRFDWWWGEGGRCVCVFASAL